MNNDIDDMDGAELRYFSAVCSELRMAHEAGDRDGVRLSLEEIEAILLHTSDPLLRRRCMATQATWQTAA